MATRNSGETDIQTITAREILLFTRYLSTMITAGLPISQALTLIAREQENSLMQNRLSLIKDAISQGQTLGEAFSQFQEDFDDLYCKVIKASERGGTLDKVLKRLADYLDKSAFLRRKIKKAITYPSIVLIVTLGVSLVLLLFVVPQFQAFFHSKPSEPPFLTRVLLDLSHFLRSFFWKGSLLFGLIVLLFYFIFKSFQSVREIIDKWMLKLKVIGPLLGKSIASRYTRALAICVDSGMSLAEGLSLMKNVTGNLVYSKAMLEISHEVSLGNALSTSMRKTELFPEMVLQMISIGETSDALPDLLNKVADYYEEEVISRIDRYGRYIEPLMILLLGAIIVPFVIAMYLPIF